MTFSRRWQGVSLRSLWACPAGQEEHWAEAWRRDVSSCSVQQHCPQRWQWYKSALCSAAATNHIWLLSSWHVAHVIKELKFWKVYFALIILNGHMWLKHSTGRVRGRWFPSLKKVWVLWYRYLSALVTQVGLLRISQTNVHFFHKQTCHSHVPAPSSSPPVSTPQSATNFHMLYLHGHWPAWDRLGRWSPNP